MNNVKNKLIYDEAYQFHLDDGGTVPDAYAVTEVIKKAIERKEYVIYHGGGYSLDNQPVNEFDVVVRFSMAGDPYFYMCMDNSEGDECDLYRCNEEGELEMIRR